MAIGDNSDAFSVDAFMRQLTAVGEDIKREVGALIQPTAAAMQSALDARYPIGAHHRNRKTIDGRVIEVPHMKHDSYIRTLPQQDVLLPVRKVVGPRLGYIWQNGTEVRQNYSRKGANRGVSPQHDRGFFERTAAQTRAAMLQQAQAIIDRPRRID